MSAKVMVQLLEESVAFDLSQVSHVAKRTEQQKVRSLQDFETTIFMSSGLFITVQTPYEEVLQQIIAAMHLAGRHG